MTVFSFMYRQISCCFSNFETRPKMNTKWILLFNISWWCLIIVAYFFVNFHCFVSLFLVMVSMHIAMAIANICSIILYRTGNGRTIARSVKNIGVYPRASNSGMKNADIFTPALRPWNWFPKSLGLTLCLKWIFHARVNSKSMHYITQNIYP